MIRNFCKNAIERGGQIVPLIIPSNETGGTGLMNPSIYDDNGKLILNLRHVNYTLYHCENEQLFNNRWGCLSYLNPENDIKLRTWNYFCSLNDDLTITDHCKVDTSKLDIPPVWEFIGLEDARLFRWDDKLYMCGCRRDVKPNGESRMELSEIEIKDSEVKEISRARIEPPNNPDSYCEKNWMPILDMPYHFVKWTNPTEVVKVDVETKASKTIFLSHKAIVGVADFRGSSQVLSWKDYKICLIHEVNLFKNYQQQKDAKYVHRFIVWDSDWNVVKMSEQFSFMDGEIEFCCGMVLRNGEFLITFGFQDNAAFVLRVPESYVEEILITPTFKEDLPVQDKLKDITDIHYLSYIDSEDRRDVLEDQFKEYGVTNYKSFITTPETEEKRKIKGKLIQAVSKKSMNCLISHLDAIKEWYNTTEDNEGLFVEDDISLDTVKYWNFTWKEFIDSLPKDWGCIQLVSIREDSQDIKLRKREWNDWSVTAYLITRQYAKTLLDKFTNENEYVFNIGEVEPHPENIIYSLGSVYTIQLLSENTLFDTIITDRKDQDKHKEAHFKSNEHVMNWWKNTGSYKPLKVLQYGQ